MVNIFSSFLSVCIGGRFFDFVWRVFFVVAFVVRSYRCFDFVCFFRGFEFGEGGRCGGFVIFVFLVGSIGFGSGGV